MTNAERIRSMSKSELREAVVRDEADQVINLRHHVKVTGSGTSQASLQKIWTDAEESGMVQEIRDCIAKGSV